jgi:hypothetical protein
MKRALILAIGIVAIAAVTTSAQAPTPPQAPAKTTVGPNFVDANGDGICDNFQSGTRQGQGNGVGRGKGQRMSPRDGSGFGAPARAGGGTGTGICDGKGPSGKGRGPRK